MNNWHVIFDDNVIMSQNKMIFFNDYLINIRIYSRKITSGIKKIILLLIRHITPAVLRMRLSSKDWLQQTQGFLMLSSKHFHIF